MRMKEGTSIDEHLNEMLKLVSELQSAGAEISDSEFHTCILLSLPQSFANQEAMLECTAKVDLRDSGLKRAIDNMPENNVCIKNET